MWTTTATKRLKIITASIFTWKYLFSLKTCVCPRPMIASFTTKLQNAVAGTGYSSHMYLQGDWECFIKIWIFPFYPALDYCFQFHFILLIYSWCAYILFAFTLWYFLLYNILHSLSFFKLLLFYFSTLISVLSVISYALTTPLTFTKGAI